MAAARLILILGVLVAVVAAVLVTWRAPDSVAISGYTQTVTGPCGPADGDLLAKVKQAGLWEMPVGTDLAARARDPAVRDAGRRISDEHHVLDGLVEKAATEIGVSLPDRATLEQEDWVRQVADSPNPDMLAVNLLRQAHGKILPLLAAVKVGTRNSTVRDFATVGLLYVGRHISYLESTGYVDYAALPEPPAPVASLPPVKAAYYAADDHPTLTFAVAALVILGVILVARLLSRPDSRKPPPSKHARRRT